MARRFVFLLALFLAVSFPTYADAPDASKEQQEKTCGDIKEHSSETIIRHMALAQKGDAVAQYCLGYMMEAGLGTVKNTKSAIEMYTKAAEHGDERAMYRLGYLYERGAGEEGNVLTKDQAKACEWYGKSTKTCDFSPAREGSAKCNVAAARGHEKNGDPKKALKLYQEAARWMEPSAMMELGRMFRDGNAVIVKPDKIRAVQWYMKARVELKKRSSAEHATTEEKEMLTESAEQIKQLFLKMDATEKENAKRIEYICFPTRRTSCLHVNRQMKY